MTYREDFTLPAELMERVSKQGFDILPELIQMVIWEGRTLLSTVIVTTRAETKMSVSGEVLQVRKARIGGAQGYSGHSNFQCVIECMAIGMDMTRMSTKKISLEDLPDNILKLQTDRSECKITYVAKQEIPILDDGQLPVIWDQRTDNETIQSRFHTTLSVPGCHLQR
jgi:hypothetical protein